MIPSLHGIFAATPTPFVGSLDQLQTEGAFATRIYSPRRLLTSYTGAACRLRSDGANTEGDINFLQNGDIDLSAVSALIASDGGTSAFCRTFYNQTGNTTFDANQTTTSIQPNFSSNYQSKGAIGGVGVPGSFLNANLGTLTQPFFINMVINFSGTAALRQIVSTSASTLNRFVRVNSNNTVAANTGSTLTTTSTILSGINRIGILGNGASSSIFINDSVAATGSMGNTQLLMIGGRLGSSSTSTTWFGQTGNTLSEFIYFETDPTVLPSWSAFLANQKSYFGTP